MIEIPHTCMMYYRGIRQNNGKQYEVFRCAICHREDWRPYTGTQDTIEYHHHLTEKQIDEIINSDPYDDDQYEAVT